MLIGNTEAESHRERAMAWIDRHENANTRKTYTSAFKQFQMWCEIEGIDPETCSDDMVAVYLQQLVSGHY
jgi:site-specific recombinase XerD